MQEWCVINVRNTFCKPEKITPHTKNSVYLLVLNIDGYLYKTKNIILMIEICTSYKLQVASSSTRICSLSQGDSKKL